MPENCSLPSMNKIKQPKNCELTLLKCAGLEAAGALTPPAFFSSNFANGMWL